ncbi:hypothetical protein F5Y13DRAFT_190135 [Hypoxylon sp. FL1857]|nr:hypothetical protein F5Y13DRAFT_190135 [Hypoxylon sp. FL1857]
MPNEEQSFVQEVWGLQGTAYLVAALRYYNRLSTFGWRNLAPDDAIMFLAVIVYTAESLMAYLVVAYWKGLANNAMTDAQRAALSPQSQEWYLRVNGSKTHVVGLLLYTTLLWLLKACWLVYYARLTYVAYLPAQLGDTDPAQSGYWSVRESFVSFVLTNMPMIYPMFRKFIEKGRSLSRSKATSQGDSRGYKLGSLPGHPISAVGKQQQTSLSVPKQTIWGSEEHILDRERTNRSDGEETSLDLPKHQVGEVSFVEQDVTPSGSTRQTGDVYGIVVTKEYTVTEGSQRGSKNFSSPVL